MEVLSGDYTLGNVLTAVGAPFRGNETRQLIAQFPGLLQLQAGLLGDLGSEATWKALAKADLETVERQSFWHRLPLQLHQLEWGIPSQDVLKKAATLRRNLDKQRDDGVKVFGGKLLLVVGKAGHTTGGYEIGNSGVVYLAAPDEGDGTVPLQSALLPGVQTWSLDCEHGNLPRRREAFDAYRELLTSGTTQKLPQLSAPQVARGAAASSAAIVRTRPSRSFLGAAPPQRELEVLASSDRVATAAPGAAPGDRTSDHGRQRRSDLHRRSAAHRPLPILAADGRRSRHGPCDWRDDERVPAARTCIRSSPAATRSSSIGSRGRTTRGSCRVRPQSSSPAWATKASCADRISCGPSARR